MIDGDILLPEEYNELPEVLISKGDCVERVKVTQSGVRQYPWAVTAYKPFRNSCLHVAIPFEHLTLNMSKEVCEVWIKEHLFERKVKRDEKGTT